MERNRRQKVLVIIALIVAIASVPIGFAAFSTTLNISSSASVTPNSGAFKVAFYASNTSSLTAGNYGDTYIYSETTNGAVASQVVLNTSTTAVSGLKATFTAPGQIVKYKFYAGNSGEYDAYLKGIKYATLDNNNYKKCTAATTDSTKATDSLVQAACDGISVNVNVNGIDYAVGNRSITGHKLSKKTYEPIIVTIAYASGLSLADGPFNIEFGDISLEYSTVDGTSNLITFNIDGTSYQAEEGMP